MFDTATPFIACFVVLRKGSKVGFVLRKNTGWMDGFYGLPAGKVEKGESYSAGAVREAKEEAGIVIDVSDLIYTHTMHRHSSNEMDWVDVYFEATKWEGEPHNAEPEKAEEFAWLDMNNLPDNVVPPFQAALEAIQRGEKYSEYGWDQ